MRPLAWFGGCALLALGAFAWSLLEGQRENTSALARLSERLDRVDARLDDQRGQRNRPGLQATPALEEAHREATPPPSPPTPDAPVASDTPKGEPERRTTPTTSAVKLAPSQEGQARADAAKQRVLQIADATQREDGIRELEAMLESTDGSTTLAALRALPALRAVKMDPHRWRPALVSHLERGPSEIRVLAAFALNNVAPDASKDVPRFIALAREDDQSAVGLAIAAMSAAGRRVDGELATLFEELLRSEDVGRARDVANALRGVPTAPGVHAAVADAWQRHQKTGQRRGLWFHILGQMQPMHRPIFEEIFKILGGSQGNREGGLLTGSRVTQRMRPEDRPYAAELAAKALLTSPSPHTRLGLLGMLQTIGSNEQAIAVRDFAANDLVTAPEREFAGRVAEALTRR